MKLLKVKATGVGIFKETVEVDFFAEQRVYANKAEMLSNVFGDIYTNNIVSFIGINASGKTSTLNLLLFIIKMLNSESINTIGNKKILQDSDKVEIQSYFYHKEAGVCKLHTTIKKNTDYMNEDRYYIEEETLWVKDEKRVTSKKALFDFENLKPFKIRDNKEEFLKDDISIIMGLNKGTNFPSYNLLSTTDINLLLGLGKYPDALIRFLDSNIEYLSYDDEKKEIKLKFVEKEEISLAHSRELNRYLSSGTIKGLNVFAFAKFAFQNGGYLLIDELENHFNQEVVATLIKFFTSETVNKKGATLIFSTHYSELLDDFDRNDCVNIVRNRGGITVEKLSNILKRNDIKRSEAYQSDFLQGTVPSYTAYMDLKDVMINSTLKVGD